jgi:NAD(P)-dependent dehydrogenase (short-subunit alcohol dehydrogenase family)
VTLSTTIVGKVVAITGVTSGIGRGVALEFVARGAKVVGAGRRLELGDALAAEAAAGPGEFSFVPTDITSPDSCANFLDTAVRLHGRLDALVNNAGGPGDPPVIDSELVSQRAWADVIELNLSGTFFCCQRAIHHLRSGGQGGVIINIASTQAVEAVSGMAAYNAAKAAVVQLGRSLAVEYLADRIRVNTVLMGGAATPASSVVIREILGEDGRIPVMPMPLYAQRLSDIGAALALLCSDASKLITGATIAMDRAMSAGSLFSTAIQHAYAGGWGFPDDEVVTPQDPRAPA